MTDHTSSSDVEFPGPSSAAADVCSRLLPTSKPPPPPASKIGQTQLLVSEVDEELFSKEWMEWIMAPLFEDMEKEGKSGKGEKVRRR